MTEFIELMASLMNAAFRGKHYRDDLNGAGLKRLVVIALLMLAVLCAGISCLVLYFV